MNPIISIIVPVYNVENYLERMLDSLRSQSLCDFEVILVNDGSTDGSMEMIKRFCAADPRFRYYTQNNQGVAMARNTGLEHIRGKYVIFYDPDDQVPENALKALYDTAEKENADLTVGIYEIIEGFRARLNRPSRRMALKKDIPKYSYDWAWSFSLCNKLYRKSVIEENQLRFDPFTFSEDAVFVFKYLMCCKKITGCNEVVYRYYLRAFWDDSSLTQTISQKSLSDAMNAYRELMKVVKREIRQDEKRLLTECLDEASIEKERMRQKTFMQRVLRRIVHFNLIGGFYRKIWQGEAIWELVAEGLDELKLDMTEQTWQSIVRQNNDLRLDPLPMTKEELAASPVISFILSDQLKPDQIPLLIAGIYNQSVPAFEVLVSETLAEWIPPIYTDQINLRVLSAHDKTFMKKAAEMAKGTYLNMIAEDVFMTANNMRAMCRILDEDSDLDFATISIKHISKDTNEVTSIPSMELAFSQEAERQRYIVNYDKLNWCLSNKLFRKASLRKHNVSLAQSQDNIVKMAYELLCYKKDHEEFMLSYSLRDANFLEKAGEIHGAMKQDQKVLHGKWKRKIFDDMVYPYLYKKYSRRPIEEQLAILLEGKNKELSSGLKLQKDKLGQTEALQVKVFYLRRDEYKTFQLKQFCQEVAAAKYIFTNEPEFFDGIELRPETKLTFIGLEEDLQIFSDKSLFLKKQKELYLQLPQTQGKKLLLYAGSFVFSPAELQELKFRLPTKWLLMIWNRSGIENQYDHMKEYDQQVVDVTKMLSLDEAIYLSHFLISDKEDDHKKASALHHPAMAVKHVEEIIDQVYPKLLTN